MRIVLFLAMLLVMPSVHAEVEVERLTWAGIKLIHGDTTVFVDAVGTDIWNGNAPGGLVPVSADTGRRYALLTHTHNDHFDPQALKSVLGDRGYVIVAEAEAAYVASRGLRVIPAPMWQPVARGGFLFTAVPAVDGLGDEQVSWVITVDEKRFFHGGDTLWHGRWSTFGQQFGPFTAAFLPINGAKLLQDPMPESAVSMTPVQAIDASLLIHATQLIPIHHGLNDPPYYTEFDNAVELLLEQGEQHGVNVLNLNPGDRLSYD